MLQLISNIGNNRGYWFTLLLLNALVLPIHVVSGAIVWSFLTILLIALCVWKLTWISAHLLD